MSVIVPCYNAVSYLEACVLSVMNQTIGAEYIELILVDDASTDNTWQEIMKWEQRYPEHIMAIHLEENCRQGGARNAGLTYASGEYIYFLDADDWIDLQLFEKILPIAHQYQTDVLQIDHYNVLEGQKEYRKECKKEGFFEIIQPEYREAFIMAAILSHGCWGKLYRNELIQKWNIRFCEKVMYEEPSFTFPILMLSQSVYCHGEALHYCRIHGKSTMQMEKTAPTHLYDHPKVQLSVLYKLLQIPGMLEQYYHLIEYYFVTTYYCETMLYLEQTGIMMEEKRLEEMKQRVKEYFPNCLSNPYFQEKNNNLKQILATAFTLD